jgi:hypothetical protein
MSVQRSRRRTLRDLTTKAALVVLGCMAGLVLAEGLLVFLVPPPIVWLAPQESYQYDSKVGHRLVPGQRSYTHSFPVATNSHGLREREFPTLPERGVVRILCLGDSLTFGDGVAVEDTYPKQLEALLRKKGNAKYEVINAGVPSYDTWQEVVYFQEWGVQLRPRIVVMGFYANDPVPRPETVKNFLTPGGTLRRQGFGGMFPDSVVHALKGSRLLLFLRDRISKVVNRIHPSFEYLHQQSLLTGTENSFVERGWREVDASLETMASLRKEHGFTLLLVIFPMPEQLVHDHPRAYYQSRVQAIANKHAIPSIDLLDSFKREFNGFGSLLIEWDGHPNPNAYRIATKEIAGFIRAMPPVQGRVCCD